MSSVRTPSLRRHKGVNQGVVTLNGRDHYLGPWPAAKQKPPVSVQQAYERLIAEWLAGGRRLPEAEHGLTVADVIVRLWPHVEQHYRRADGTATGEPREYRAAFRPLNHLYGTLPAAEFSPLKLEAVRGLMVSGYTHPRYGPQAALSRGVINQRVGRIVRLYRWATAKELVPPDVYHRLRTVAGLQAGRRKARETEPVKPVADVMIDAVLPHVAKEVAAMVRLQRLTGMRPGEIVVLRARDMEMTGDTWWYRPAHHKLAYRGKPRAVPLGPKAQAIIKDFLVLDTQAYLFSPVRALARRQAKLRAERKTPVPRSQQNRRKRNPKKTAGDHYTSSSYAHAVRAGCDLAWPPPAPLAQRADETLAAWQARLTAGEKEELAAWQREHRWFPNQLRHSAATEIRKHFGLEAAQVVLQHGEGQTTLIYAERDLALAARVAAAIG
jgi:integrase